MTRLATLSIIVLFSLTLLSSGLFSDVFASHGTTTVPTLSNTSCVQNSFSVNSQEATSTDVTFNSDGTKMYVIGEANDTVYQYSLSSAYDVSTASYDSVSFSVSSSDNYPEGITFNSDGTKMYMIGLGSDSVYQYSLSSAYDVSTIATLEKINSLNHDTFAFYNSFVQVDSDTYALAYQGPDSDGFISTFTLPSDGSSVTEVATLEHDVDIVRYNSFVQVDSDTYALAYSSTDEDGQISTFTIPSDGSTITEVATLEHTTTWARHNSLVQVDSDTYALAYSDNAGNGQISTFTISADGSTITEVASLEHDAGNGTYNSFVQVDSDTYALAYQGPDSDGFISTFTISADGSTITEVASLEHDTNYGTYNSFVQVDSDTYALAYTDSDNDGQISTFTISADGSTITEVASLEHDTSNATNNSLVQVDSNTYALAYMGTDADGFISTFTISSDGSTITKLDTVEHDTSLGQFNSLVQVDSNTYALAYDGVNRGHISTFTISAAGVMDSVSVSSQGNDPADIIFNSDGTKMFTVDLGNDSVFEYALSSAFDVSTASYTSTFDASTQDTGPQDIAFNSDGTKMFVMGQVTDKVYQYSLSTGYSVSTASYDSVSFSVANPELGAVGLTFNSDGTKMFVDGYNTDAVHEYTLSSAFDLSTISCAHPFDVSLYELGAVGLTFNSDGTKMFVVGYNNDKVNEYTLTTPYDFSSASYVDGFDVSSQEATATDVTFNSDGTKMYVIGEANDTIYQYSLSSAYDVSTASYDSVSFSISAQDGNPEGITFNSDGTKIFVIGLSSDQVHEYSLSSAYDISTASYVDGFSVSSQGNDPADVIFNSDGTKMFTVDLGNDSVFEYSLSSAYDISTASYTSTFDASTQDTGPQDIAFNSDGTKMFVMGQVTDAIYTYTLQYAFDVYHFIASPHGGSSCYDCTPPHLVDDITVMVSSDDPSIIDSDGITNIQSNAGDSITITLNVNDNKGFEEIKQVSFLTYFAPRPDDMNLYYANNYNALKEVSTTFYEWHKNSEDVVFDYSGNVSFTEPIITSDDNMTISFTMTCDAPIPITEVMVKLMDSKGNSMRTTLPFTLEIIDSESTDPYPEYYEASLVNEPVLLAVLSQWSGYSQVISDDAEMLSTMGLQGESLPAWTKNLGEWVIQEKLDVAELIMAIEYVNNQ